MAEKPSGSALLAPVLSFLGGGLLASLTFLSGVLDREVRNREVDVEVMKIAFQVMSLPREQTGEAYRRWACEVMDGQTEPKLDCSKAEVTGAVLGDPGQFRNMALGDRVAGNPNATDVGLFVCREGDGTLDPVRAAAAALRDSGFGSFTLKPWTLLGEVPMAELANRTTIIFDAGHPEADEVPKLEQALASVDGLSPIRERHNTGGVSPWYISIIFCQEER